MKCISHPRGASEKRAGSEYGAWKRDKSWRTKVWGPTGEIWVRRRSPGEKIYPVLWRATFRGQEEKEGAGKADRKAATSEMGDNMGV